MNYSASESGQFLAAPARTVCGRPGPAGRIALGCVAENNSKFLAQAIRWVQSVRWHGGHAAQADVYVCVVDALDERARELLHGYGAKTLVVPRWSVFNGSSNRLDLVRMEEFQSYDHTILMDCDTILTRCPCEFLEGGGLAAKPADAETVRNADLARLYARFDVQPPALRTETSIDRKRMYPYVNAGVVCFDQATLRRFAPRWAAHSDALLHDGRWRHHPHVSQAAFALALAEVIDRFRALPPAANYPTHFKLGEVPEAMKDADPAVVHYHSKVNGDGTVQATGIPAVDARIADFNARFMAERDAKAALRDFWNRHLADPHRTAPLPDSRAPFPVVVGVGRSGTTLLRLMMDSHSQLAIPFETQFAARMAELSGTPAEQREEFLRILGGHLRWPEMHVPLDELRTDVNLLDPFTPGDGLRAFYRRYALRFGKPRGGDKTPGYAERITVIAGLLPEAHFIHLIRDGRGVALSMRNTWWAKGEGIAELARHWMHRVQAARRQSHGLNYIEVRYEDLIRNPEAVLRRICDFIDLPYEAGMLRYTERARERIAELGPMKTTRAEATGEERRAIHARSMQPPDVAMVDKWRTALTPEEIRAFNAEAGPTLEALGYPLD